ncbi:MAG: alpha/beta fold hydrolase [Phycisphaerales bacterium JB043]
MSWVLSIMDHLRAHVTSRRWLTIASLGITPALVPGCGFPSFSTPESLIPTQFTYTVPSQSDWAIQGYQSPDATLPRVIFVHGTPGAGSNFTRYVLDPIPGTQSVAYDRPGFGNTQPRSAIPELELQASALEPLLVERDGSWPVLVGHSLGGPIVVQAAAMYPDRVRAIVILAGSLDPELERVRFIQHVGNFFLVPHLIPRDLRNANREVLPLKKTLVPLGELLPTLTCPIVIVHGTRDKLVPYANVDYMLERFTPTQDVEVITIEGGNHFLPWNAEETVRQAIASALDIETHTSAPSLEMAQ